MRKRPGGTGCLVNTKAIKSSQSLVSFAQQKYLVSYLLGTAFAIRFKFFFISHQKEVINFKCYFNFHITNVFLKRFLRLIHACVRHLSCLLASIFDYTLVLQCFSFQDHIIKFCALDK